MNEIEIEHERKFLVRYLPDDMSNFKEFEQAYLEVTAESEDRIRKEGDIYCRTQKGDGALSRPHSENSIDCQEYNLLMAKRMSRTIRKNRYLIPISNHNKPAQLDIYEDNLLGLVVVEVEFDDEAQAALFEIPDWFGKEITYDKRMKNKNLATCSAEEIKVILAEYAFHPIVPSVKVLK